MNNALGNPLWRTLRRVDRIVSLMSLVVVPLLVSVAVFWYVERPPYQQLKVSKTFEAQAGQSGQAGQADQVINVGVPLDLRLETKKAAYYVILNDEQSNAAYVFPTHEVLNPRDFRIGDLKMQVPSTLKPGRYSITLIYTYWFNPFKNGEVEVDLGVLNLNS